MAKLILKSPYIKSTGGASGYLKYIATRERVEIIPDDRPPTRKQEQLITKLVKDFPDSKTLYEYEDYISKPTKANAYANSLLRQQNSGRPPNVFLGVTRLLHHMGRIFQEHSLPQSNPGGIQIDRKRLEELMEKREAHGLKGNVYEEYRGPTMSM